MNTSEPINIIILVSLIIQVVFNVPIIYIVSGGSRKNGFQTNECTVELRPLLVTHCAVKLGKIPFSARGIGFSLVFVELASCYEQSEL